MVTPPPPPQTTRGPSTCALIPLRSHANLASRALRSLERQQPPSASTAACDVLTHSVICHQICPPTRSLRCHFDIAVRMAAPNSQWASAAPGLSVHARQHRLTRESASTSFLLPRRAETFPRRWCGGPGSGPVASQTGAFHKEGRCLRWRRTDRLPVAQLGAFHLVTFHFLSVEMIISMRT